jgi:ComF family protein
MSLLHVLLPPACAACGRFGPALCGGCLAGLRPAGRPEDCFLAPDPGVVVGDALEVGLAAFAYQGSLRRALGRLKYAGVADVATPLADAALPTLRRLVTLVGPAPLVPVPVHPERRRERGYNQAALLARGLGRAVHLPVADLLTRERATARQHHLDRAGRLRNLRGAFTMADGSRAPPTVILVDDILTTSATLETCAAVLRGAGARRVAGIAIAREI